MNLLWAGVITLLVALALAFANKWFDDRMRKSELTEASLKHDKESWGV